MTQKFIPIGNSWGFIVPKAVFEEMGFKPGQEFELISDKQTKSLIISADGKTAKQLTVSPHLLTILEKVNKEYGPALKKLASL